MRVDNKLGDVEVEGDEAIAMTVVIGEYPEDADANIDLVILQSCREAMERDLQLMLARYAREYADWLAADAGGLQRREFEDGKVPSTSVSREPDKAHTEDAGGSGTIAATVIVMEDDEQPDDAVDVIVTPDRYEQLRRDVRSIVARYAAAHRDDLAGVTAPASEDSGVIAKKKSPRARGARRTGLNAKASNTGSVTRAAAEGKPGRAIPASRVAAAS